jgi:methyltransferase
MVWYVLLIGTVALERLAEFIVAERNRGWSRAHGSVEFGARHYPSMVMLHMGLLAGCPVEAIAWQRPFIPSLGWPMLAIVLAAQSLRWWCIATLGRQWNTRVIVVPGAGRVTSGPYRLVSHPNYVAVVSRWLIGWPWNCRRPRATVTSVRAASSGCRTWPGS